MARNYTKDEVLANLRIKPNAKELSSNEINKLNNLPKQTLTEESEKYFDQKSWDELDKQNLLTRIKKENPEYYEKRFFVQFGKKPKNK